MAWLYAGSMVCTSKDVSRDYKTIYRVPGKAVWYHTAVLYSGPRYDTHKTQKVFSSYCTAVRYDPQVLDTNFYK